MLVHHTVPLPKMDSSHRFTHKPLNPNRRQVRLLSLLPGKAGPVECKLYNVNATYRRPYRAVSYTWGPQKPQREIQVNGKPLNVGENLWHFLNTLRRRSDFHSRTRLWIDQICIDQSCTEERNHHVLLMGHIFYNAEVLVWLGPASLNSGLAVSAIIDPPPGSARSPRLCTEIRRNL
jgi:hypothetical protein